MKQKQRILEFMKQTKILIINDTLSQHGGAESYVHSLDNLLKGNGYITKLFGSTEGVGLNSNFFSRWYSIKYYFLTKKVIKDFQPDIIHINSIARILSPSILVAASSFSIPIVQTVHDYHYICPKSWMVDDKNKLISSHNSSIDCIFHHMPKHNLIYAIFQNIKSNFHKLFLKKYVDHFICPSKDLTNWYKKKFSHRSITYVPNFVENGLLDSSSTRNFNEILFVGRLSKEKGIDDLIQAFSNLRLLIPQLVLTIVGEGPEKKYILNLVEKLNLTKHVNIVGNVKRENLNNYYHNSTVVVIPSRWVENCPMVALESITHGKPLIVPYAGGLKDMIKNDISGYFYERNSIEDLSAKLYKLLSDKKKIIRFSKFQLESSELYTGKHHLKEIQFVYNSLLQK